MDVRYINPFIESIKHLFKTMLGTELIVSKPVLSADDVRTDVSAVIGLSGDAVGCVVLCFPKATAIKAAGAFSGEEMDLEHEDFADAVGELANMIAGAAKAKLEGLNMSISLPSVIVGAQHTVLKSKQRPTLIIPCDSPLGRFTVEVAMVIQNKQAAGSPEPRPPAQAPVTGAV